VSFEGVMVGSTEVVMSAREMLQEVQVALEKRACDAKFCFSNGVADTPLSFAAADVHVALDAYIQGRVHPLAELGDSVR
jgi:hypothetical protein